MTYFCCNFQTLLACKIGHKCQIGTKFFIQPSNPPLWRSWKFQLDRSSQFGFTFSKWQYLNNITFIRFFCSSFVQTHFLQNWATSGQKGFHVVSNFGHLAIWFESRFSPNFEKWGQKVHSEKYGTILFFFHEQEPGLERKVPEPLVPEEVRVPIYHNSSIMIGKGLSVQDFNVRSGHWMIRWWKHQTCS